MAKITLEESELLNLIRQACEKTSEEVSVKSYRKGWLDAASMTRLIAERNMVHQEILLAVADSMEKAAEPPAQEITIKSQDKGAL